jgi:hypothetical protein
MERDLQEFQNMDFTPDNLLFLEDKSRRIRHNPQKSKEFKGFGLAARLLLF